MNPKVVFSLSRRQTKFFNCLHRFPLVTRSFFSPHTLCHRFAADSLVRLPRLRVFERDLWIFPQNLSRSFRSSLNFQCLHAGMRVALSKVDCLRGCVMKVLIGYDGSRCSESALDDITHAGLPEKGEALV